jgi:hypothetical protein
MNTISTSATSLWQPGLTWIGISLLCGLCLMFFYQQAPPTYRPILRNARWIVIPYLALLAGGISPRLLGLTGINWSASFGFGLVLIGGVLLLLLLVRSVMVFSIPVPQATLQSLPPIDFPAKIAHPPLPSHPNYGQYIITLPTSFLDLGAEEFHLAFLRSALWEIFLAVPLATAQAGYWAAWTALLIALPESLHDSMSFSQRLCKCALLVTTTVLFIFTRNLWLSWLLHLLGWMLLAPSTLHFRKDTPGFQESPSNPV